jgi:deazaflavin-dependent oxidoreductase (nitroreductase family)
MGMKSDRVSRLAALRTIELTTIGRHSGSEARIEIWWFYVDGRFIITGTPGRRDWYANVLANPRVVVHTGDSDIVGRATPVSDSEFRSRVFTHPDVGWYQTQAELERLVATSPMIEIELS